VSDYTAIFFDLDDTLLNRKEAVKKFFPSFVNMLRVLDMNSQQTYPVDVSTMFIKFCEYDNIGAHDADIIKRFLCEYKFKVQIDEVICYWNENLPKCFSIPKTTLEIISKIKSLFKIGIITNGLTMVQKSKICQTQLDKFFDIVIISDEVGVKKPDKRIFDIALQRLNVTPEKALYVGDNIVNDIMGCQNASIRGIWFNPKRSKNCTDVSPMFEIADLAELLRFI
jgi:putative hydrolase of the HAD superfamily